MGPLIFKCFYYLLSPSLGCPGLEVGSLVPEVQSRASFIGADKGVARVTVFFIGPFARP